MINPKIKGVLSLLLALSFLIVVLSGIALFLSPPGRIAKMEGWSFLGLNKESWGMVHLLSGVVMSLLAVVHFGLNLPMLIHELKR